MRDEDIIAFHRRLPPFRAKRMDWRRLQPPCKQVSALPEPDLQLAKTSTPQDDLIDPDAPSDEPGDTNAPGHNLLNPDCCIYQEIAKIAAVMRTTEPLRFGRMYFRPISGDGVRFGLPFGSTYTLAFSRILYGREVLVAYNVSASARSDRVLIDGGMHKDGDTLQFLYGGSGTVTAQTAPGNTRFVRLDLAPHQFVVLE
jgi:hypothetical protein